MIPAAFMTAFQTSAEHEVFFTFEALYDSGTVRLWTGEGEIEIQGQTFYGAGNLLGISETERTNEVVARGVTITLSGIPAELVRQALDEPYSGREARMAMGLIDVDETMELFRGFIDKMNIEESANTAMIAITIEHELVELLKTRVRRYTHESQQRRYPGDKAFEFVNDLRPDLEWGGS